VSGADRAAYLLAVSLAGGLGGFALAADCYRRFLARRGARVLDAYAAVLLLALVPGIAVLGPAAVFGTPGPLGLALALPLGLAAGIAARRFDRTVIRRAARRAAARRASVRAGTGRAGGVRNGAGRAGAADGPVGAGRVTPTAGALLLGGGARREPPAQRGTSADYLDPRQFPLGTVLAVAAAEEVFYRGVLLRAALLPAGWVAPALAVATVVAFALAHVTFGWPHVLAKAPLGVLAAVLVLALGSVLPALAAHLWFNLSVWRDIRAAAPAPA
jgi:membrane protease YdiL (CAAX protease family)